MDLTFKILPPVVVIVLLLSSEYGEFLLSFLVDQSISMWKDGTSEDEKREIKAYALLFSDATALFAGWLLTTATAIPLVASVDAAELARILVVVAVILAIGGILVLIHVIRTAEPDTYLCETRRRLLIFSLPGSGTPSKVFACSCVLAAINIAFIVIAATSTGNSVSGSPEQRYVGDLNCDGAIDGLDTLILAKEEASLGPVGCGPQLGAIQFDLNCDGRVGRQDILVLGASVSGVDLPQGATGGCPKAGSWVPVVVSPAH